MKKEIKNVVEIRMIKELLRKIQNADEIVIEFYDNHCPYLNCDGGCYSFGIRYQKIDEDDNFRMEHFTSSDFSYCDVFGYFQDCSTCMYFDHDSGDCRADYGWKPFWDIFLDVIESIIEGSIFELKIDGEVMIDCKGHFPGYCSRCNCEYSDEIYYRGETIDRDIVSEFIAREVK